MSFSVNTCTIGGNVTADIELKYAGETPIADVGLAINDRHKVNGEWTDYVSFVEVTVFGRQAELCQEYLQKGTPAIFVNCKYRQDRWEKDGQKRSKGKFIGGNLQLLPKNTNAGNQPARQQPAGEYKSQRYQPESGPATTAPESPF